ncbi:EcsC family protein [Konateibacter massiliensis]|uniref:EcsC family protein n=1 Tax=Konateibacter massiliensis TaxID=2002841 RepID=UPI000C14F9D7|nr:EcsC family protein [Konateibacter massiliensis]
MDKRQMLLKQLALVEKQEAKLLSQKENEFVKARMKPALEKLHEKIPAPLKSGLETAFYKGFQLVFQKGNTYIEKTYNREKLEIEYDLNNYAIDKHSSKRHLKKLDKSSGQSKAVNQSIAALEGGILGFFGIGLPDIPIFISVMVKTLNEIALSYGYPYDTKEEKVYMLFVICGALSKEEEQKEYTKKINLLGKSIDTSAPVDYDLDTVMKETAALLSGTLLAAKAVQGIPIVGVLGGAVNPAIISRLGKYAKITYKKRFLQKKLKENLS